MENNKTLYIVNREDWRKWLEENYNKESEIWLIFYKKHTNKPRLPYDDAVEEALCFGWIDSIVKRIDDEKYIQKFTPRKNTSNWSELNISRIKKLIKEGKMTDIGLSKINNILDNDQPVTTSKQKLEIELTEDLVLELKANKQAWEYFSQLAPSHKKNYIAWIMLAKKPSTRNNRLKQAIELLSQNQKLGLK